MISLLTDSRIIVFLLIFFLWALAHSLLASLTIKDILSRRLGRYYHFYRVFYVVLSIVSLIALFILFPLPQGRLYAFDGALFYILKAIQTIALVALLFTATISIEDDFLGLRAAKKFFSARLDSNDTKPLRTSGIMGYSRHPLYFFITVLLWSDPQMTAAWFTVTLSFSIYFLIGSIFEERKLIFLYGDDYINYQKKVRRFIPLKKVHKRLRSERYS